MKNETYQISEADRLTGEKAHVLRYWEEELGLTIGRNAMGHRFYTAEDIQIFLSIKELKKKGLHLKAIRDLLPKLQQAVGQAVQESIPEEAVEILPAKMTAEVNARTVEEEPETVEVREVTDDRQAQFYEILERLLRQMMLKKRQEERYKRVDEAIRRHQQSRKEAAATVEASDRKKKKGRK